MRYRSPLPRGPLLEGVIVDDCDMMCIVPRTVRADEAAEETEAIGPAKQAYASVGLHPEPTKTFISQDNADF